MVYKELILISLTLSIFAGCKSESDSSPSVQAYTCRGEYTVTDANGIVRQRFNEYVVNTLGCVSDPMSLSVFEKQAAARFDHNIKCTPQSIPSVTLLSKNNYYWPRNDSIYLDLNSQTGQFRRLILGKTIDGVPLFQREIGCWYQRADNVTESYGNRDFGSQILLDLELASSSLEVHPMEVYRYTKSGANWDTIRFDDADGVDWTFCNPDGLPFEYCTALRNGNYMYYPENLDANTMAELKAEILLIRAQYNFIETSKSSFEQKWTDAIANRKEFGTAEAIKKNYKFEFGISGMPDVPFYTDRNWRSFLRAEAPQMPDTSSIRLPPICYSGQRDILLNNGSTSRINGEVCYINGTYVFTAK
jgi:hypothetical protein